MSKINFTGGAGGVNVVGELPTSSGILYVKVDGSRGMTGNLLPGTSGLYSVGTDTRTFGSGVFGTALVVSGIQLKNIANEFSIRNNTDGAYNPVVAQELLTETSGASASGSAILLQSSGLVGFSSATTPASDGTHDVNISRKASGILRVGTTTLNALGGLEANSGVFPSGALVIAAHGSGCVIKVDNNGLLTVTGPFTYV